MAIIVLKTSKQQRGTSTTFDQTIILSPLQVLTSFILCRVALAMHYITIYTAMNILRNFSYLGKCILITKLKQRINKYSVESRK